MIQMTGLGAEDWSEHNMYAVYVTSKIEISKGQKVRVNPHVTAADHSNKGQKGAV